MSIIVDPGFTPPPPPAVATSADGRLKVIADNAHAGARLVADFSDLVPLPRRVRFLRSDGSPVRSGDPAYAPGGMAVAYDHEAPLGGPVSWVAVPVFADGSEGTTTDAAALTLLPAAASRMWVKPLVDSDLSVIGRMSRAEESGRPLRATVTPVVGAEMPAGGWDVALSWTGQITFRTDTEAEYVALLAALSAGPVLAQPSGCAGLPTDMYLLPQGELAAVRMSGAATGQGWKFREWAVSMVQVGRPTTLDSPLIIPGLSWDDMTPLYSSWDNVVAVVPSWYALLGVD